MSDVFVSKTQAISIVSVETGFGRRVIEKAMDTLEQAGRIKIHVPPEGHAIRIRRSDVDVIIRYLKGEDK
jgi:hypothetical protein